MNSETAYIDDYFNNLLPPEERLVFEQRCLAEEEFAEEVAQYLVLRQEMQWQVDAERKERWRKLREQEVVAPTKTKFVSLKKWGWAVAAAVALIAFLFWPGKGDLKTASDEYIAGHFKTLGVSMNSSETTLQQGINKYNAGAYAEAVEAFGTIIEKAPGDLYALRYRGLSYLMLQNFDAAIADFETLSHIPDLASNPGYFYTALVLLQRDQSGDMISARKILQYVVDNELEGHREALTWLRK